MTAPARRTSLVVTLVAVTGFVLVAWWQVPWHPVPGGTPSPVDPGTVLTAAQIERAEAFSRWARAWSWSSLVVSLAVACWLGLTAAGERLVGRLRGPWPVRVVLAVLACAVVGRVATLPFAVALQVLRRDVGLSRQGWTDWARDLAVGELVGVVAVATVLVVLVACARRWERAWPVVGAACAAALVMLGSFVYPVVVEPLTTDVRQLAEGPLRADVLRIAEIEGVDVDGVLVSDASERTTTYNAYVSGFGATRRVVLYDTLVEGVEREQILSVVAHELAHARHDDVLVGSVLGALGAATAVGLLGLVLGRRRPEHPAVVPRVLALVAIAGLLASPVQSGISRLVELRADAEALAATGDPASFVELQRTMALRSLADPTPPTWSQWWFGSHPTMPERVALAGP